MRPTKIQKGALWMMILMGVVSVCGLFGWFDKDTARWSIVTLALIWSVGRDIHPNE